MKILFWVICSIIGLLILIYIIGLLLPKERVVTRETLFPVSPEILYTIVTNNKDWKYRKDLKDLVIIEKNGDYEVWQEITKDGSIIRFTTKEKMPYSRYSFQMETKMFSGYWVATFQSVNNKETFFTATEYISVKNPFIKTISYLFFDVGELMENYQKDLMEKVKATIKK